MQTPTKMDDLGVPPFQETSIYWILDIILDQNGSIYCLFFGDSILELYHMSIYIHISYIYVDYESTLLDIILDSILDY